MIAQLFGSLWTVSPLAGLTVLVWAFWAVAGLTPWTWLGIGVAVVFAINTLHWQGPAVLDAAAVAAGVCYFVECIYDAQARCPWCRGTPRRYNSSNDKNFHWCWICGGRGYRVRWGARLRGVGRDVDD